MKPAFDDFSKPVADRRKFLLGVLFCSAAGIAAWRQPSRKLNYLGQEKLEQLVPKKIGRWSYVAASGLVVPPNDQLAQTLYSQLLTRVYSDGQNSPIMLLLAQSAGQTGFLQIHRPETCYTASGFQISSVEPHPIQLGRQVIHSLAMDATAEGPTEHVIYWTRIGNMMPMSWKQQKIAVAEQNLQGIVPDAILVRISCVGNDGVTARNQIDDFVRSLVESVPARMRSVFVV